MGRMSEPHPSPTKSDPSSDPAGGSILSAGTEKAGSCSILKGEARGLRVSGMGSSLTAMDGRLVLAKANIEQHGMW